MLRVIHIGEATRFHVESATLQCVNAECAKLFPRRLRPDLRIGGPCPTCGKELDVRFHLVDVAAYFRNGQCSCEFFQFVKEPILCRMTPDRQALGLQRCQHIEAARAFALDVTVEAHERQFGEKRVANDPKKIYYLKPA